MNKIDLRAKAQVNRQLNVLDKFDDGSYFDNGFTLVLRVRAGGKVFQFSSDQLQPGVTLGRTRSIDVLSLSLDLNDLGVSREHAYIRFNAQSQNLLVFDLNSANGTFINGNRLGSNENRVLRHGDKLHLGRLSFAVTILHDLNELEIS